MNQTGMTLLSGSDSLSRLPVCFEFEKLVTASEAYQAATTRKEAKLRPASSETAEEFIARPFPASLLSSFCGRQCGGGNRTHTELLLKRLLF